MKAVRAEPDPRLSNTLSATLSPVAEAKPGDLARFAVDRPPPDVLIPGPPGLNTDSGPIRVEAEQECPRCAERVKARAKVCRFCGHEFVPEDDEEEDEPTPAPRARRPITASSGRHRAVTRRQRLAAPRSSDATLILAIIFALIIVGVAIVLLVQVARSDGTAPAATSGDLIWVGPYVKKDGTYVHGYWRHR